MPTLYNLALSPYAARVRLAAYWRGLEDAVSFAEPPGGLKSEAYLKKNPLGKVPALKLENGFCLPESELIVEYLEDAFPGRPLRPSDPETAARARLAARLCDLYVAPGLGPIFRNANPRERDEAAVNTGFETLATALAQIDAYLDSAGPWAVGPAPSTADCALVPVLWFVEWADGWYGRTTLAGTPRCRRVLDAAKADGQASRVIGELATALRSRFS
ncbi:MAG: glutathione S-transferase family protein [Oceanicaulis sp.]